MKSHKKVEVLGAVVSGYQAPSSEVKQLGHLGIACILKLPGNLREVPFSYQDGKTREYFASGDSADFEEECMADETKCVTLQSLRRLLAGLVQVHCSCSIRV